VVELLPSKQNVVGSNPIARSNSLQHNIKEITMKKFILTMMMVLGMAATAHAETFVTLSGGQVRTGNDDRSAYGVAAGADISKYLRGEVAYDYYDANTGNGRGQTLVANAIAQYRIPGTIFTPYALAGAGYGWQSFGDQTIYNIGAGVRAEVTKAVDFDLRVKRVGNFDNVQWDNQSTVVTAGVSFKF
jgi:hypothetical protein